MSIFPIAYIWNMAFHNEPCTDIKGNGMPTVPLNNASDCCTFFGSGNIHRNSSMAYSVSMYITTTHATAMMGALFFFPCLFMWQSYFSNEHVKKFCCKGVTYKGNPHILCYSRLLAVNFTVLFFFQLSFIFFLAFPTKPYYLKPHAIATSVFTLLGVIHLAMKSC